ncbi:MAG: SIMPL domain-containing protein [Candidatus Limnocylindrales bacterium]
MTDDVGGQAPGGISVRGVGRVAVVPDQATVEAAVAATAKTAAGAQEAVARALTKVLEALEAAGVASRDRVSAAMTLDAEYAYPADGKPTRLTGYRARHALHVTVRPLDRLGAVLDAAIAAGATDIGGVRLSVGDSSHATDQARELAVHDAIRHGQVLARAAGVGLGPVTRIDESASLHEPVAPLAAMRTMSAAATPVAVGETILEVAVSITFQIA